jgi:hypothetical protein
MSLVKKCFEALQFTDDTNASFGSVGRPGAAGREG